MKTENKNPNVFLTLDHLLNLEQFSAVLNLKTGKQKSNSVLSGNYSSKLRGRGLDFEEARPYVMGDDIRNIDWRITAKTGKTHTKVFTEEKEKPAFIFVDQSESMGFGSQHKTKSVVAGELAAILAHKIKKSGDRIGGMVYSVEDYDIVTPKRDTKNSIHFFQKIVQANQHIYEQKPFDLESSLTEVMSRLQHVITHDYLVFIISDFHRYNDNVLQYINQLALHNDVVLIKIYDPLEEVIPSQKIVLSDKERQISINGKNKNLQKELQVDFEKNYKTFESKLGALGTTIFKINTVDAIEDQLLELFNNYNV
ncbi:DUF58 domain-containing protein [Lacinutrix jangbogonensis]|uniref:DUF58 domain-containing protein n=1 Tax=Lacinutrix jangbogonensis TaxID=1469557 RepID=UPI00053E95FC|nr:DUF58 domain-containing protein [Lacinutrix jangbogonensis]